MFLKQEAFTELHCANTKTHYVNNITIEVAHSREQC